jgi:VWFA-related protein
MVASSTGAWPRFFTISAILFLYTVSSIFSQGNQGLVSNTELQVGKSNESLKIKVDVDEVRLDAVVVDGNGRQITDLTAEDFKIYQDGRIQGINGCRYVSLEPEQAEGEPVPSPASRKAAVIPAPAPKRDAVRRSIVLLVSDYGMAFEDINRTRIALRKYVEEQMQPGDLISVFKTSRGSASLQAFTSDKRELLARIENIQWRTDTVAVGSANDEGVPDMQELGVFYCIKALENMPGRRLIMLITGGITMGSEYDRLKWLRYQKLGNQALQAEVVIHTMDIKGLIVGMPWDGAGDRAARDEEAFIPLSKMTGGLLLTGFNWFVDGIGPDMREQLRGYYLLSYTPPKNTFSKLGSLEHHSIKIEVNRRGATVLTREGFYADPSVFKSMKEFEIPAGSPSPLVDAMFSPFQYNDLNVSLSTGYIDDRTEGYLLPTWMHLEGRNLQYVREWDGRYSIAFKAGASTTQIDGLFQDYGDMEIGFHVDGADIQKIRKDGIHFSISIPVKKAGGYYVRVAAIDQFSGARGSAYQFIEVPDLKKKRLALSSLYVINREEDAAWIRSITTGESTKTSGSSQPAIYTNPANKSYRPGDSLDYMAVVYNAKTKKDNPPDLQSQFVLYRDGVVVHKSAEEAIETGDARDFKKIPIRRTLHLEESLQPGDYVLQFLVRDNNAKKEQNLATQTLSFRIAGE